MATKMVKRTLCFVATKMVKRDLSFVAAKLVIFILAAQIQNRLDIPIQRFHDESPNTYCSRQSEYSIETVYISCTAKKDRDQVALGSALQVYIPTEAY
jgi:hypothetical protein